MAKPVCCIEKKFIFRNNPGELFALLNEMLLFVEQNMPAEAYERIESKCKLILIELFTNAVKHSGAAGTMMGIVVYEDHIVLSKLDNERPFHVPASSHCEEISVPVDPQLCGLKKIIYSDDVACLYCIPEHSHKLVFTVEDSNIGIPPVPENLLEHFGLMIIAKASDEFIYTYMPETGENHFTVRINYPTLD